MRVNPDGIEIVSYAGPHAWTRFEALNVCKIVARRYRYRRIGEFLKELKRTEGRCTGIPTVREAMAEDGSPPPKFSTHEGRTYYLTELPVHRGLLGVGQEHDESHERAHEELTEPEAKVLTFVENRPAELGTV